MKSVVSVRIDQDLREAAQEIAKSAGLTLSALVNSFLRQVVSTRRIELYAPEPMTPKLEALIVSVEQEIASGEMSRPFSTVDDFLADLKS